MQNMRVHGALPLVKLYPTGKVTIERMLAKGWIEIGGLPETYHITPAGEAALKAKIPTYRRKRTSLVEVGLKAKGNEACAAEATDRGRNASSETLVRQKVSAEDSGPAF
jgi:hypothetical protein